MKLNLPLGRRKKLVGRLLPNKDLSIDSNDSLIVLDVHVPAYVISLRSQTLKYCRSECLIGRRRNESMILGHEPTFHA
jgi:hypothetical protein